MVVTGLEIGALVVGCVNATLAASKLIQKWYSKRRERKEAEANLKLAETLRSDASRVNASYLSQRSQLPHRHRHRFEKGDDLSRAEIEPHKHRIQSIMAALQEAVRSSKARNILPCLRSYVTASHDSHHAIVVALARLHQRIVHELRVSPYINPFLAMFNDSRKVNDTYKMETAIAYDSPFEMCVMRGAARPASGCSSKCGCMRAYKHHSRSRPCGKYALHQERLWAAPCAPVQSVRCHVPVHPALPATLQPGTWW